MPLYVVRTKRFGNILIEADDIKKARAHARTAFKVRNPEMVRRSEPYKHCDDCDSAPCCCG